MSHLYILWTNADPIMFDKMISMYARNSKINHWWDEVTVIIWGSTAKTAIESELVKNGIVQLLHVGVNVSACKACSDSLGTTDELEKMGVEVKYWGEGLTSILKNDEKLLTI